MELNQYHLLLEGHTTLNMSCLPAHRDVGLISVISKIISRNKHAAGVTIQWTPRHMMSCEADDLIGVDWVSSCVLTVLILS